MSENPLVNQASLEDIASNCEEQCHMFESDMYDVILSACFQSKAQGLDECINFVDNMLHADTKHLTKNERSMMYQTLNNLRTLFSHQRSLLIDDYDNDDNGYNV